MSNNNDQNYNHGLGDQDIMDERIDQVPTPNSGNGDASNMPSASPQYNQGNMHNRYNYVIAEASSYDQASQHNGTREFVQMRTVSGSNTGSPQAPNYDQNQQHGGGRDYGQMQTMNGSNIGSPQAPTYDPNQPHNGPMEYVQMPSGHVSNIGSPQAIYPSLFGPRSENVNYFQGHSMQGGQGAYPSPYHHNHSGHNGGQYQAVNDRMDAMPHGSNNRCFSNQRGNNPSAEAYYPPQIAGHAQTYFQPQHASHRNQYFPAQHDGHSSPFFPQQNAGHSNAHFHQQHGGHAPPNPYRHQQMRNTGQGNIQQNHSQPQARMPQQQNRDVNQRIIRIGFEAPMYIHPENERGYTLSHLVHGRPPADATNDETNRVVELSDSSDDESDETTLSNTDTGTREDPELGTNADSKSGNSENTLTSQPVDGTGNGDATTGNRETSKSIPQMRNESVTENKTLSGTADTKPTMDSFRNDDAQSTVETSQTTSVVSISDNALVGENIEQVTERLELDEKPSEIAKVATTSETLLIPIEDDAIGYVVEEVVEASKQNEELTDSVSSNMAMKSEKGRSGNEDGNKSDVKNDDEEKKTNDTKVISGSKSPHQPENDAIEKDDQRDMEKSKQIDGNISVTSNSQSGSDGNLGDEELVKKQNDRKTGFKVTSPSEPGRSSSGKDDAVEENSEQAAETLKRSDEKRDEAKKESDETKRSGSKDLSQIMSNLKDKQRKETKKHKDLAKPEPIGRSHAYERLNVTVDHKRAKSIKDISSLTVSPGQNTQKKTKDSLTSPASSVTMMRDNNSAEPQMKKDQIAGPAQSSPRKRTMVGEFYESKGTKAPEILENNEETIDSHSSNNGVRGEEKRIAGASTESTTGSSKEASISASASRRLVENKRDRYLMDFVEISDSDDEMSSGTEPSALKTSPNNPKNTAPQEQKCFKTAVPTAFQNYQIVHDREAQESAKNAKKIPDKEIETITEQAKRAYENIKKPQGSHSSSNSHQAGKPPMKSAAPVVEPQDARGRKRSLSKQKERKTDTSSSSSESGTERKKNKTNSDETSSSDSDSIPEVLTLEERKAKIENSRFNCLLDCDLEELNLLLYAPKTPLFSKKRVRKLNRRAMRKKLRSKKFGPENRIFKYGDTPPISPIPEGEEVESTSTVLPIALPNTSSTFPTPSTKINDGASSSKNLDRRSSDTQSGSKRAYRKRVASQRKKDGNDSSSDEDYDPSNVNKRQRAKVPKSQSSKDRDVVDAKKKESLAAKKLPKQKTNPVKKSSNPKVASSVQQPPARKDQTTKKSKPEERNTEESDDSEDSLSSFTDTDDGEIVVTQLPVESRFLGDTSTEESESSDDDVPPVPLEPNPSNSDLAEMVFRSINSTFPKAEPKFDNDKKNYIAKSPFKALLAYNEAQLRIVLKGAERIDTKGIRRLNVTRAQQYSTACQQEEPVLDQIIALACNSFSDQKGTRDRIFEFVLSNYQFNCPVWKVLKAFDRDMAHLQALGELRTMTSRRGTVRYYHFKSRRGKEEDKIYPPDEQQKRLRERAKIRRAEENEITDTSDNEGPKPNDFYEDYENEEVEGKPGVVYPRDLGDLHRRTRLSDQLQFRTPREIRKYTKMCNQPCDVLTVSPLSSKFAHFLKYSEVQMLEALERVQDVDVTGVERFDPPNLQTIIELSDEVPRFENAIIEAFCAAPNGVSTTPDVFEYIVSNYHVNATIPKGYESVRQAVQKLLEQNKLAKHGTVDSGQYRFNKQTKPSGSYITHTPNATEPPLSMLDALSVALKVLYVKKGVREQDVWTYFVSNNWFEARRDTLSYLQRAYEILRQRGEVRRNKEGLFLFTKAYRKFSGIGGTAKPAIAYPVAYVPVRKEPKP